jgi:hypothetical protein
VPILVTIGAFVLIAIVALAGVAAFGGFVPGAKSAASRSAAPGSSADKSAKTSRSATPRPASGTFTQTGAMGTARCDETATLLKNGKVLVVGGNSATAVLASAELYDPADGTFTATGSLTKARQGHTATLLADGRVLIAGGWADAQGHQALSSVEVYDPKTGVFTPVGLMNESRADFTATLLADGSVLMVGGADPGGSGGPVLASSEIKVPGSAKIVAGPTMAAPRTEHTATLLKDGRVLVAGGWNVESSDASISSAEVYVPKTATFSKVGSMTVNRSFHSATLLKDGTVLIASGQSGVATGVTIASAEIFDPTTNKFTATGSLASARTFLVPIVMPNGRVLFAGGSTNAGSLSSVEIYDPAAGKFSSGKPLPTKLSEYAATLLPGGQVLIVGGRADGVATHGALLYQP